MTVKELKAEIAAKSTELTLQAAEHRELGKKCRELEKEIRDLKDDLLTELDKK